jgi:uncharacterized protein (TIGR03435 family)
MLIPRKERPGFVESAHSGFAVSGAAGILVLWLVLNGSPAVSRAQAAAPTALPPMPADADPAFEVATIKSSDTSSPHGTFFTTRGRHVIAYNISLEGLITFAYGVHAKQIVDGPSSLLNTHFDIDGIPDVVGRPNHNQSRLLYQKLLASRFKLAFHYDHRELAAYAIDVAKEGQKLTPTTRQPGDMMTFTYTNQVILTVRNASMADFAKGMQETFMDKPVVDQTGLKDRYDFDLKWTPDEMQSNVQVPAQSRDDANAPPGLYTAIHEQLGLRIVPTKAPVEVLVIDHLEKPSEN